MTHERGDVIGTEHDIFTQNKSLQNLDQSINEPYAQIKIFSKIEKNQTFNDSTFEGSLLRAASCSTVTGTKRFWIFWRFSSAEKEKWIGLEEYPVSKQDIIIHRHTTQ